jgi:hypothetical protein
MTTPINKIERVKRSVIERKLLDCLNDESKVAVLLTKQDLEDLIVALYGWGREGKRALPWEDHLQRRKELAQSLCELRDAAFK